MEHAGPRSDAAGEARHERLGGARAEFVANLGRRVAELRAMVRRIEADDDSPRLVEELKRRLHSLGAGARLLRFARVAERLAEGESQLVAASGARLTGEAAAALRKVLEELPALAWGQSAMGEQPPASREHAAPAAQPSARGAGARQEAAETAAGAKAQGTTWIAGVSNGRGLAPEPLSLDEEEDAGASPSASRRAEPAAPAAAPGAAALEAPITVLVVGASPLADALEQGGADVGPSFEVERTDEVETAIDLARAFAPDVVLLDADMPGARGLAEALAGDPLTELVPVVAVGRFARPEDAAPYVALGAARALAKPVSPDALRRAAAEAAATCVRPETARGPARGPLGAVSLDELGSRLAEELRRGLCDAAEPRSRGTNVDLGDGAEVLAALWGAVARIRDLVTIRSQGGVRFSPNGPEGALPLAPWMTAPSAPEGERARPHSEIRAKAPARGAGVSAAPGVAALGAMDIVVADDDPAVTWFLAGVLRAAGATVHEAHDGARALDLAYQTTPDLVVSDVLMPRLDGFALCRALKRDVALRDVPVILLSWKEDLLQRLRELGAQADGYLRKEASAAAFVQRVHEVLRGRRRVAERIATGGEVRGRLDGMTTRTLLSLSCAHRPDALVSVRDAAFLYEVLIKDGRPAGATRTAQDGTFHRGPSVLAALLGVGSGRFAVAPAPESELEAPPRPGFEGTLAEQLVPAIAAARAAQRLLHGPPLMQVERVILDLEGMGATADATPEPARSLLRALARGVSPRSVITTGEFASSLVEDVLNDVAARGGVRRVIGRDGDDLLAPAVSYEEETLRGLRRAPERAAPAAVLLPELGGDAAVASSRAPGELDDNQVTVVPGSVAPISAMSAPSSAAPISAMSAPSSAAPISVVSAAPSSAAPISAMSAPSSAAPISVVSAAGSAASIPVVSVDGEDETTTLASARRAETRALASARVPREFGELQGEVLGATWTTPGDAAALASVTPAVPGVAPAPRRRGATLPALEYPKPERLVTLGSLPPPPVIEEPPPAPAALKAPPAPAARVAAPAPAPAIDESPTPRRVRKPSAYVPTPPPPARDSRMTMWVLFAVAAFVFAVGARLSRDHELQGAPPPGPLPSPPAADPAAATPGAAAVPAVATAPGAAAVSAVTTAPAAAGGPVGETAESPVLPEDLPLAAEHKVPEGHGVLEVIAGAGDTLFVDGRKVGTGSVKLPLAPKAGAYEIRAKLRDEERVRFALVKAGRLTRLRVSPPWRR
ncbi:response regulator [Sorangium sp. So ce291]|uniref:response regulator n=1 Tax=Sorangium sp. So ce291 TaxID=3133294 RepID=UPI003F63F810